MAAIIGWVRQKKHRSAGEKPPGKQNMKSSDSFLQKYWHLLALALIAVLSFGLNFYAISQTGYGNAYYAAAIKSMTQSFHNFFFVSFDPAGMVSVDKPPLGLWIQAAFVLVFGYHGWAMLLPQALAGTGSCIMMYVLTAKHFGRPAGLISALVFALTPAVVVASRNNTIDMQLIFFLLVAVWFLFRAIEKTKWRYLFLCALFVGLGFNIKMLQAYMILPAIAIIYLIFAKEKFLKRLLAGLLSIAIMAVVSFAWVIAVDLTPASDRPYVDSSTNNTVSELIIGHNGLERLYGQSMGGGGGSAGGNAQFGGQRSQFQQNGQGGNGTPPTMTNQNGNTAGTSTDGNTANGPTGGLDGTSGQTVDGSGVAPSGNQSFSDGSGSRFGGMTGQGGVSGNDIGTAGVFRLWNSSLYGQASWLILLTFFCIAVKLRKPDWKNLTVRQAAFVFWILWLITMYLFFSFAGFWHRYYLCMFAPGIAGLVGPGLIAMIRAFREKQGWKQSLLPVSFLVTFVMEIVYVWSYSALRTWLVPLMAAAFAVTLILMTLHYVRPKRLLRFAFTGCMLISLLAAPLYWCLTVVIYVPQNVTMPYAGPELASTESAAGMTANQEALTTGDSGTVSLESYLVENYKEGSFLVVSQRADNVAQFIVDTGLPAYAYGGFLGSDNSLTLDELKEMVAEGKVTYFLVSGENGNSNSELISYVEENATLISPSEYGGTDSQQSDGNTAGQTNGISGSALYLFEN